MSGGEAYPFVLPRPEMAAWSWLRDGVHCPRPLPPLVGDVVADWYGRVAGRPIAVVNGYVYLSLGPGMQQVRIPAAPQSAAAEAWYGFYAPRALAVAGWVDGREWDAEPVTAIVTELPDIVEALASAFAGTMAPFGELSGALANLVAFCRRYLGEGELTAATLVAGSPNATSAIGAGIAALAQSAAANPAVAAAVRTGDLSLLVGDAGERWWADFEAFVTEYGRGNETWFEFHVPPWREDPSPALLLIARHLAGDAARVAGDARTGQLHAALDGLPGEAERDHLRALVAACADYVGVVEDRARVQLVLAGAPRAPLLAAGRQLATAGALAEPGDVFFLRLRELRMLGDGVTLEALAEVIARRKHAFAAWGRLSPPDTLGLGLPRGYERVASLRHQFGVGAPGSAEENVLRGFAASAGIAHGVARVIEDVADGERLGRGEILVCRNTAPPWTPLFAVAGAVVTETGGILSHAAIAAREYALPAVVGVRDATRAIADGAHVTVDGAAGTVTLDG